MDFQHHHVGVRELDLSTCHATSFTDKINAVPGLRTSTAFFTFLRANLVLSSSALSSHHNTPQLQPYTTTSHFAPAYSPSFPAPSQASLATAPAAVRPASPSPLASSPPLVPIDDIPPLSLEPLDDPVDKAEGLHLVAESVSQMRQRAVRAVAFHPVPLAAYAATLVASCTNVLPTRSAKSDQDLGLSLLVACAVTVTYALAVHFTAGGSGYARLASQIGLPEWLVPDGGGTSDNDIVLGARLGDTIVGALVLRLLPSPAGIAGNKRKGRGGATTCLRGGRGVIRAWTTAASHRGEGIGRDLLMSAVRITKERCGRDAEVGFAKEHANSVMLMPGLFTRVFRRNEIMATKVLSGTVAEWEMSKKKR